MLNLVAKPEKAPVVRGEGVYMIHCNFVPLGLRIRARNAKDADRKLEWLLRRETKGRLLDFRIEDYEDTKGETDGQEESADAGTAADTVGS